MSIKEKPDEKPTWNTISYQADKKEREELSLLLANFNDGVFVGKIVANWCPKCGRWRLTYLSVVSLAGDLERETFKCVTCKRKLPVKTDAFHTILDNCGKTRIDTEGNQVKTDKNPSGNEQIPVDSFEEDK